MLNKEQRKFLDLPNEKYNTEVIFLFFNVISTTNCLNSPQYLHTLLVNIPHANLVGH